MLSDFGRDKEKNSFKKKKKKTQKSCQKTFQRKKVDPTLRVIMVPRLFGKKQLSERHLAETMFC
jgi:hypothetical protein